MLALFRHGETINEIDNDEWDKVFNVNVKGIALTIKHSVELMKTSGGYKI